MMNLPGLIKFAFFVEFEQFIPTSTLVLELLMDFLGNI